MGSGRTAVPEWGVPEWEVAGRWCRNRGGVGSGRTAVPEWMVPEWGLAKGMMPEGGMGYETF